MTVLAGDYQLSTAEDMTKYVGPIKIVEGPTWAIGLADSSRTEHYISKVVTNRTQFKTTKQVLAFADKLAKVILASGTYTPDTSEGGFIEFPLELLVASPWGLWEIQSDLSVFEIPEFSAIGSGKVVAMGAYEAIKQHNDSLVLTSREVAETCLTAAGTIIMNVGTTFWYRGYVHA